MIALVSLGFIVAVFAGTVPVTEKPLNDLIASFEAVNINPKDVLAQPDFSPRQPHRRPFKMNVKSDNREFQLDLKPNTQLFHGDAQIVERTQGELRPVDISDRQYYKGHIAGQPGVTSVHMRVAADGTCHGTISTETETYTLEPSDWHFEEEQSFNHVLHAYSDHVRAGPMNSSTCQTMDAPPLAADHDEDATQQFARMRRAVFDNSRTACDVALVADYKFFSSVGGSSVSTTIEKLTLAFANVQDLYTDNTLTVSGVIIGIKIGRVEIVTDSGDTTYKLATTNGPQFLEKFAASDWDAFCLAHLFTRQEFDNGLLGLAYMGRASSTPGGICQTRSGNSNANTGFSTYINYGSDVPWLTTWLVLAHELGHNFGADHDADSGSGDGQFLMYPVSVDGSQRNNFKFSSASQTSIEGVVAAKGGCFKVADGETCGNLLQEGTEECDCGTESICAASPAVDKCCNVYNDDDASDPNNCKIKSGFECSPLNLQSGTCCTEDCGFKPIGSECREETQCTKTVLCAASGVCADADPFPEDTYCDMGDTFKDKLCDDSGKCTKSICDLAGLDDSFETGDNACKVTCTLNSVSTLYENIPTGNFGSERPVKRSDGTDDVLPTGTLLRSPGSRCLYEADNGDDAVGICGTGSNPKCQSADGGRTAFDELENALRNLSAKDALNWALRTDRVMPNWAWLLAGFVIAAALVSCLCKASNRADRKR